ncbi:MAG TPA: hypothetical protein PKG53_00370 [Bacillota bacterium]|nr:hypothetical protein [Bacillota bacterium]
MHSPKTLLLFWNDFTILLFRAVKDRDLFRKRFISFTTTLILQYIMA